MRPAIPAVVDGATSAGGEPRLAQRDWPAAVVAGAYQTGVLGVRSLLRRGVRAVCCDSNQARPGFRSIYGPARLSPDPDHDLAAWCDFMAELARELGDRPVLIASSDKFVSAIARCEHELRGSYRLSNSAALQGQLAEKSSQYRLAADYGLPLPLTKFVGSEHDLITAADAMSFPCLLKPNHFREWLGFESGHRLYDRKIAIARSASELLQIYRLAEPVTPSVIIQDLIQGDDRAKRVYLSCRDAGGRKIGSAVFRELRCDPVQFGPATVSEPVEDHDVESTCDQFLSRIGYTGICEFEMKWDSRDGKLRLIEANPRLSGGGDAAPYAGVDLCWLHYLDLIGQCVDPVAPDGTSFRHIVLRSDGSAIPAYRRAGLISWREIFESYRAPRAFYDLDWHDWRYSLETLAVAATNLVRGFLSRRGGRDT